MIASEPRNQEPTDNEPEGFVTSSNKKTGRPPWMQPRWKLAGIDQEGGHHVLQTDDHLLYAIQNGRVVAKERLDDYRNGRTISDWRSYVAEKRGWRVFFLTVVDFEGAFENVGGKP